MKVSEHSSVDGRATSFYRISTDPSAAYVDPKTSQISVGKLANFDSDPSILVCLAHDTAMMHGLPTLNENPEDDLNAWRGRGLKEKIHWGWLNELPRDGKPGRKAVVEGFWRDMKPWPEARDVMRKNGEKASKVGLH